MRYMFSVTVAVLLMALSVYSASAQSPGLTNADVIRLVTMHVSDQTVIAVIHEATATRFDLGDIAVSSLRAFGVSTAVVATMRQPSTTTPPHAQSPTAATQTQTQTLAGASTQAKAQDAANGYTFHPRLSVAGPSSPPASTTEGAKSEATPTVAKPDVKDEAYWRGRDLPGVFRTS